MTGARKAPPGWWIVLVWSPGARSWIGQLVNPDAAVVSDTKARATASPCRTPQDAYKQAACKWFAKAGRVPAWISRRSARAAGCTGGPVGFLGDRDQWLGAEGGTR